MIDEIIKNCLAEDIGEADHSSLSCVPVDASGSAKLLVKEEGIIAGVELAERIFKHYDSNLKFEKIRSDGDAVAYGDIVFKVSGNSRSILATERLVLNFMQRMSGIATKTHYLSGIIEEYNTTLLDTRKTTPGIREIEKWAVRIGGGVNHRMGLYDMIMLKDNHIDYAGGVSKAIEATHDYLEKNNQNLKIEIEVRSEEELKEVLQSKRVDRIMLDNFTPSRIIEVKDLIPSDIEIEASGGIDEDTLLDYAKTGVDFISMGALTHSVKSLDMSLKADFN